MSDPTPPDTRARDGSAADRKWTPTQTAAAIGQGTSGIITLMYFFACWKAHAIVTPSIEQGAGLLGTFGPYFHLLGRIVMYWTSKLLPKDAST